jgi:RND superfamily putative drug exporter
MQETVVARGTWLRRLAGWSYRRRWWAVAAWVLAVAVVSAASSAVGAAWHNDFSLPGAQSQQALDTLRAHAPAEAGGTIRVVVADRSGLADPGVQRRVSDMLDRLATLPHVAGVRSPYQDRSALAPDGTVGYATVALDGSDQDVPPDAVKRIVETARDTAGAGLRVEVGGESVVGVEEGGGSAEGVGLLAALVVLVLLFGSILAAALPVVIDLFAVGIAVGLVGLASHVSTVADFTTSLMALVGLGVGIDYAMLLFSRYRTEVLAGADNAEAVGRAVDTAGRTVLVAGGTVIVALLGLVVLGQGSLQGVAVAVASTVLVTMVAAVTLLPALLAITGRPIRRAVLRRAARSRGDGARWARWSRRVQRRPWAAVLVGVSLLGAACLALPGMRLGIADAGNNDPSRTSRAAYDLLAEGFGPGFNGPLLVVVDGSPAAAAAARADLAGTPGVASVSPPLPSPDGAVSTLIVVPDSRPQDAATADLVRRLRADVLPPLHERTGAAYLVGGVTAAAVDFSAAIGARLGVFVLVVVGLSALLLLLVFRSLLIPLKAALLNLLGVGAALGVVTLVFQRGVLAGPLGVQPGPVEAFVPVMIFAIAFGLSMDYEVFLVSRMHESWRRHGDASAAIREGMATTGRVVTAAAAIMVVVFASFLLDPGRMLKQFGLGLAVAVLVDAVVLRCLLVPAVMQLLGARAWWLPSFLRRLPHLALEPATAPLGDEPVRPRREEAVPS